MWTFLTFASFGWLALLGMLGHSVLQLSGRITSMSVPARVASEIVGLIGFEGSPRRLIQACVAGC